MTAVSHLEFKIFICRYLIVMEFKSAAVHQISSKLDDFLLRYGDMMIFKMVVATVRHPETILHVDESRCTTG